MKPLNYAILKHFTTIKEGSVDDVMEALHSQYNNFKAFNKKSITSAIMTAEANGLLEETGFEMNNNNELVVFYHASEEGAQTINHYIKD